MAQQYIEADWNKLCAITDELVKSGKFGSRPAAFKEAVRLHPELNSTPPTAKDVGIGGRQGASSAKPWREVMRDIETRETGRKVRSPKGTENVR